MVRAAFSLESPLLIPITVNGRPAYAVIRLRSCGTSAMHGPHQEPQKTSITTLLPGADQAPQIIEQRFHAQGDRGIGFELAFGSQAAFDQFDDSVDRLDSCFTQTRDERLG